MVYPERQSELVMFRELFTDEAHVNKNYGELFGSPTFDGGLVLNGINQYAKYEAVYFGRQTKITKVIRFTPRFEADSGDFKVLTDSDDNRLAVLKLTGGELSIYVGGTIVQNIPLATYEDYWNVDEKNDLIISTESGDTSAWLNGTEILSNDATVYTPANSGNVFIGTSSTLTGDFEGVIHEVSYHKFVIDSVEEKKIRNGTLFDELTENKFLLSIPMKTFYNDGSDDVTENLGSATGRVLWGNGGAYIPTVREPRGATFAGAYDLLTVEDQTAQEFDFDGSESWFISVFLDAVSGVAIVEREGADSKWNLAISSSLKKFNFYLKEAGQVGSNFTNASPVITGSSVHCIAIWDATTRKRIYYINGEYNNTSAVFSGDYSSGANDIKIGLRYDDSLLALRIGKFLPTPTQNRELYQRDILNHNSR